MVFHNVLHTLIVISISVGVKITSYNSKYLYIVYTCVRKKSKLKGSRSIIEKKHCHWPVLFPKKSFKCYRTWIYDAIRMLFFVPINVKDVPPQTIETVYSGWYRFSLKVYAVSLSTLGILELKPQAT